MSNTELVLELDKFLVENNIKKDDWEAAELDLALLVQIKKDYEDQMGNLNEAAELIAKILQKCDEVHSVRWRVKEPSHVLEKIVRKRASGAGKYKSISLENYTDLITDLVGVRVLHLFKHDWLNIHRYITRVWEPVEDVIAYIREGDEGPVVTSYSENDCRAEAHPAGYRSIHYVIATQPTIRKIFSEIQVRTIFEEGWSEIDHKIRYPNFSDNELVAYFLTIFNRMAGSADEMGTFVKQLSAEIALHDTNRNDAQQKIEEHLSKIEELADELNEEKEQNKSNSNHLAELKDEIKELRAKNTSSNYLSHLNDIEMGAIGSTNNIAAALANIDAQRVLSSEVFNSYNKLISEQSILGKFKKGQVVNPDLHDLVLNISKPNKSDDEGQ